jgi:hypothetical protein
MFKCGWLIDSGGHPVYGLRSIVLHAIERERISEDGTYAGVPTTLAYDSAETIALFSATGTTVLTYDASICSISSPP